MSIPLVPLEQISQYPKYDFGKPPLPVVGGHKEGQVKEEHLCQVAEGTAIGKRTKDEEVVVIPNAWFCIGAQIEARLMCVSNTLPRSGLKMHIVQRTPMSTMKTIQ